MLLVLYCLFRRRGTRGSRKKVRLGCIALTHDHSPESKSEKERLESHGARVVVVEEDGVDAPDVRVEMDLIEDVDKDSAGAAATGEVAGDVDDETEVSVEAEAKKKVKFAAEVGEKDDDDKGIQ